MYKNNIRFRWVRNKYRDPIGAVVQDINTGKFGWSLCDPYDRFSKKFGRNLAFARLQKMKKPFNKLKKETQKELPRVILKKIKYMETYVPLKKE